MTTIKRRAMATAVQFEPALHPILQRIYAARGITATEQLEKELSGLLPFEQLLGIDKAAHLLADALMQQQRIMIIGDFDTDGATSSALAVTALRAFGAEQVNYLVPNRFEYGYGLTPEIVATAQQWQPDMLVTVDNGISSMSGVTAAKELGMTVIITDHHLPAATLPAADAIVNPNQNGCPFPSKNLAGVGVIFYVMLALRSYLRQQDWFSQQQIPEPNLGQLLDLVALGTVADVVPLDKNNRILVHQGLKRMRAGRVRPGIAALLGIANRQLSTIVAQDLAFAVAPRLNAAGRLDDMSIGIVCLLSDNQQEAQGIASQLDLLNQERKQIELDMSNQAFALLKELNVAKQAPSGVCLYDPNWHQGVIGILASRVKDRSHRPVIAFAKSDETYIKGSARSISGIHIRDCLEAIANAHPTLITKFGGHAMAAGLTIKAQDFEQFQHLFQQEVQRHLTPELAQGVVYTDGELQAEDFNLSLAELLRHAEPWGQAFPEPVFDGQFQLIDQRIVGGKHLKMTLSLPGSHQVYDAIAFNIDLEQWPNHRAQDIHAVYRLDINEFRGRKTLQLIVQYVTATINKQRDSTSTLAVKEQSLSEEIC